MDLLLFLPGYLQGALLSHQIKPNWEQNLKPNVFENADFNQATADMKMTTLSEKPTDVK